MRKTSERTSWRSNAGTPGWDTCIACGNPKRRGLGFRCPACYGLAVRESVKRGFGSKDRVEPSDDTLSAVYRHQVSRGVHPSRMDPRVRAMANRKTP